MTHYQSTYIKRILTHLKWKINGDTVKLGNSKVSFSKIFWICRQTIDKETVDLTMQLGKVDLIDVFKCLYPTIGEYAFSTAHMEYYRIKNIMDNII